MLKNDFKKDFKQALLDEDIHSKDIAERNGFSRAFVSAMWGKQIILPNFVKIWDSMGYDIEIKYIKRNNKK